MTGLPELVGEQWFNSSSLKAEDLKNKAVLIDFWTYSCVNCQRTLPYLREWWQKYKDKNFVIIGIHAPEFEFEKDPKNVKQAIKDFKIDWPILLDNDHVNWNNFSNHYWPAKYLFDREGKLIYEHFGEGNYEETEAWIQSLFKEDGEMSRIAKRNHEHGGVCFVPTPELYCGYGRGRLSNLEGYRYDNPFYYKAPAMMSEDSIALDGNFAARAEYIESLEPDATLMLRFRATEVNLVMAPVGKEAAAEIYFEGRPIKTIVIKKATLYNLLKENKLIEGVLMIKPQKGNFRAYAFTFSGCV